MESKDDSDDTKNLPMLEDEEEPVNSDDSNDDLSDDEILSSPTTCLFCDNVSITIDIAVNHLSEEHKINLQSLKKKFHMDQYSYIKMINCIRKEQIQAQAIVEAETPFWNDDKYLKPIEYEPWLTYDFEEISGVDSENPIQNLDELLGGGENGNIPVASINLIVNLANQLKEKDMFLQLAVADVMKMRKRFKQLLEKEADQNVKLKNCVAHVSSKVDEGYFSSYAHFSIHHEMLSDTVRTETYRNALLNNAEFLKGKTVLDVGCGTAILSMFASQAGAERVIAIDNSEIIYNAMDIAKRNNIEIEFVKGRLEDTELPVEKVDIIISEWMGYFLIFEGMLDTIIYARDRHLNPGGSLIPNRCNISIVGYGDEERYDSLISFWDSVYGFDMAIMKKDVLQEPIVELCKPECILTDANIIADYDLNTVDINYSNFSFDFNLNVTKTGKLTSFVSYFDTFFDLPNSTHFSTSPNAKPTHWKQAVFFLDESKDVVEGSVIKGTLTCKRNRKDLRSLLITINVYGKDHFYHFD